MSATLPLVKLWPEGKPMHQLAELEIMFCVKELKEVVRELQVRLAALEAGNR